MNPTSIPGEPPESEIREGRVAAFGEKFRFREPLADMMAKDSKCRWGNYFSTIGFPVLIGLETDPLVGAMLLHRFASNTTTSISNMIGPMEEISLHGHPIAYIAPSVYRHAHALTIHFLGYANKMTVSIGVDSTAIPNPHKLRDEIDDSLKAMKAALLGRGLL
ncbi:unnamed protein product [Thlaspi arvense]|uniref:O-acyltransferase WSD1 C-terminal domain-containing protein n=1 Tax=Thlaspi arvense TaxID=13288 RepID=A0AAU9T6V7_THLAR|nr:unnamed protein product [Thlaspi arvense]